MIRKMIPASDKVSVTPIKNQDGTTAHSEEEILEALGTPQDNPQWNEVFAREIEAKLDAINSEEGGDLDHDFDSLEVQEAVDALNYHKAAAEDGTKESHVQMRGGSSHTRSVCGVWAPGRPQQTRKQRKMEKNSEKQRNSHFWRQE